MSTEMTKAEMKSELERLKAEIKAKTAVERAQIRFQVGKAGGVSVYGLGRFPVTLYKEQWLRLLGVVDSLRKFIDENDHLLKKKSA